MGCLVQDDREQKLGAHLGKSASSHKSSRATQNPAGPATVLFWSDPGREGSTGPWPASGAQSELPVLH